MQAARGQSQARPPLRRGHREILAEPGACHCPSSGDVSAVLDKQDRSCETLPGELERSKAHHRDELVIRTLKKIGIPASTSDTIFINPASPTPADRWLMRDRVSNHKPDPGRTEGARDYLYLPKSLDLPQNANPPQLPGMLGWDTAPFQEVRDLVGPLKLSPLVASTAPDVD
jgi:hypothetical protein